MLLTVHWQMTLCLFESHLRLHLLLRRRIPEVVIAGGVVGQHVCTVQSLGQRA